MSNDRSKGRGSGTRGADGPWYAEGLQFECSACGQCCGGEPGYIWMTEDEIRQAAAALGMHVLDFCTMFLAEFDRGFSLREHDGGDCCMLRDGKCLIYAARPLQCRTWPWWPSNLRSSRSWQEAARRCPGINRGRRWSLKEIERERRKMDI